MKAIVNTVYGAPDVLALKEVDQPVPKDGELLIKIHATTVNRTDCANLTARPFIMRFVTGLFKPKNHIQGTDFSGEVIGVGRSVKNFKIGERVFGFGDAGVSSHAEYMTIAEDKGVDTIPNNFNYEEAVASIEGFHYAYNIMNKVPIEKGQKILVNGATGAIGSALVQMLDYHGVEVTAVGNTKNLEMMRSIGAHRVFDYTKEDFTQSNLQFDYVFDAVGKSSFGKCKPLLNHGGVYISSEMGQRGENLFYALLAPLLSKFPGNDRKKVVFPVPSDIKKSLQVVKKMIEENKFQAIIDRRYLLAEIAEAYRFVMTGEKTGNVIIKNQIP